MRAPRSSRRSGPSAFVSSAWSAAPPVTTRSTSHMLLWSRYSSFFFALPVRHRKIGDLPAAHATRLDAGERARRHADRAGHRSCTEKRSACHPALPTSSLARLDSDELTLWRSSVRPYCETGVGVGTQRKPDELMAENGAPMRTHRGVRWRVGQGSARAVPARCSAQLVRMGAPAAVKFVLRMLAARSQLEHGVAAAPGLVCGPGRGRWASAGG